MRTEIPEFQKVQFSRFPTSCSAHRSLRIPKSAFLRFPTFCSARRSPRIPESAFFEISDVLCSAHRRPGAHAILALDLLNLPGSISLAWVYESSVGLQDKRPKGRQAPNIEHSPRKKCDQKKGTRPGSLGPVQDRTRPSAHVILAWVY